MMTNYILKGKTPVPVEDTLEWAQAFQSQDRIVKQDAFPEDIRVSTVFLGIDHSFGGARPLLFETMIFGGENDGYQERYSTWEEAEEGHKRAVLLVAPNPPPSLS